MLTNARRVDGSMGRYESMHWELLILALSKVSDVRTTFPDWKGFLVVEEVLISLQVALFHPAPGIAHSRQIRRSPLTAHISQTFRLQTAHS